ncbi:ABC transporter substrate-binding protein [candidate division KSB1 bacterium]|nr:ABC transporter substrate-binding protein [candidate division KSB1 bacterium]
MIGIIILGCFAGCQTHRHSELANVPPDNYQRIISLSPSTTEILFALGLGDRIVGVTRFCVYPPEALEKQQVGGFLDPNYEAIVMLKPDLIITLPEFRQSEQYFEKLEIPYLTVDNKKIDDIFTAIQRIGTACKTESLATSLVSRIHSTIDSLKTNNISYRPRVLISIGRTFGTGHIQNMYIAGQNTLYDEMIRLAGAINAYEDSLIAYPNVSSEGVLLMKPDVIFELLPHMNNRENDIQSLYNDWNSLPTVPAVRNKTIYILTNDYVTIPGPRFVLLLRDLAERIRKQGSQIIHE